MDEGLGYLLRFPFGTYSMGMIWVVIERLLRDVNYHDNFAFL
ncbi:MAG: hypothetical protein ACFFD4_32040 [Candidatus Odinarchaeota archaeon]